MKTGIKVLVKYTSGKYQYHKAADHSVVFKLKRNPSVVGFVVWSLPTGKRICELHRGLDF